MTHDEYYCAIANYKEDRAIKHFGIPGQKWGVRRFQNADGSWTPAGKERYSKALDRYDRKIAKGGSEKRIARLKQKRAATYLNMKVNEKANKAFANNPKIKKDIDQLKAQKPGIAGLAVGQGMVWGQNGYDKAKELNSIVRIKNLSNALNGNPTRYRYYDTKKSAVVNGVIGAAGGAAAGAALSARQRSV